MTNRRLRASSPAFPNQKTSTLCTCQKMKVRGYGDVMPHGELEGNSSGAGLLGAGGEAPNTN